MACLRPALLVALLSIGCTTKTEDVDALRIRVVTLPGGGQIRAEVLTTQEEMARGMMFRDALPLGHGLLFVHAKAGPYKYWMSNVKVELDIIFMDSRRRIVEISGNTPPCLTRPADCPVYGGHSDEQFVLELRSGEAQRLGLKAGQTLEF
jgi:uncharacterized membrane protein (UPF0127 family)